MWFRSLLLLGFGLVSVCHDINETIKRRPTMLAIRPTRIVGGKDAEKGHHPWQLSIRWADPKKGIKPRHICGGSLLTAGWVITAGHCGVLVPRNGEFSVQAGKYRLGIVEETEQISSVDSVFVYPEYNGTVGPYDIALMRLQVPFELNPFVSTVTLPYPEGIPTGDAMLTGWGSIGRTRALDIPEILQAATLPIIDYDQCKEIFDKTLKSTTRNPLHPTNICTGPLDGSLSACKGDSGGPLIKTNAFGEVEIVGIVSWGVFPCGRKNAPSVYTRVSAFVTWITSIVLNH